MLTAIRKNGLILATFACLSTGVVALTHQLTESQIKKQEKIQLLSILNQVIPKKLHDNELSQSKLLLPMVITVRLKSLSALKMMARLPAPEFWHITKLRGWVTKLT